MTIDLTQFAEPEQKKGFKWWAGKKPTVDLKEFAQHPDYGYGLRQNKTQKGKGYFGEIPLEGEKKGIMTELGSEMDVGDQKVHYPLIVPTLNKEEIDLLKKGEKPTEAIQKKAQEHAIMRISQGLDPFASVEEEGKTPLPKEKTQIDKYLEMPREEFMKLPIDQRKDIAKQIGEKGKEEFDMSIGRGAIPGYALLERKMIEKGYIDKPKVLSETQQAFGEAAGSMLPISIMGKGIDLATKGFLNLNKWQKIATTIGGWAVAGAAYQSVTDWEKTGKTPTPQDILKHGAFWGGIEAAIQSLPYIGKFAKTIVNGIRNLKPKTLEEAAENITNKLNDFVSETPSKKNQPIELKLPEEKKVKDSISFGEGPKPEAEKKGTYKTFYTDVVDKYNPVKKMVQGIPGWKDLPISENPYKLARLFSGINGKVETFLHYKTFDPITLKFNGKGLSEILKPIKKDLNGFSEYLTAKRAIELENGGIKTGVNLADAENVVKNGSKEYEKNAQEIYEYQKRVLDYAEKQGLLSPELRKQWDDMYKNYVPFKRVIEDGENTYFGSSMQPKSPFYRIEGSERPIIDPLQSIIGNTYLTLRAADQNNVITKLVNTAKKKEEQILTGIPELIEEKQMTTKDVIDAMKESNIMENGKVKYFENGKAKTYQLPEEVADAVKGLKSQEFGLLNKILSYPTRLLRTGAITLSPGTLLKLATVDQLEAFLYTNVGYIPYVDMVKGLYKAFKKPEMYWQWKAAGGDQSLARELSRAGKEQKLKQVAGIGDTKNVIKSPDEILRKFEELSAPLEKSTRLSVFEKALKRRGMSADDLREAALMSREATLDFARKGAKTKLMNQAIPFFNAAIQGADKFFRAVKDNPKMLWKAGATVTLPTLGLYWLNKDNKKYQELPDWEKNAYWHMYVPYMGKELHFKVSKPFELGMVFGNVPERIAEYAYKKDKSSLEQIPKSLWDTFTPSFTPAVAEPILEYKANKSLFSGAPIIPQRLEKMTPADQIGPYTSETAKKLGQALSHIPYIGDTKIASPIMIDHWLNSMTGGAGSTFVALTEKMLRNTGITPERIDPEKELADLPVLKSFFGKEGYTAQSKSIQQFYDDVEKMEGKSKALNLARKEHRTKDAERLSKEVNPSKLKYAQKIRKAFSKSFSAIRNIQIDEEHYNSAEKKILIDQLIKDMVGTARFYLGKD